MADTKAVNKGNARSDKDGDSLNGVAPDVALRLMRDMLLFRRFEERAEEGYAIGKIGGFCHLHIDRRARRPVPSVRSVRRLRDRAPIREHTQALAKGLSARAVMAELYGRVDGCSGGRAGRCICSMSRSVSSAEPRSSVARCRARPASGSRSAIGGRSAWRSVFSARLRSTQGAFHESLNLAAVWKLPVIYAVENNVYGMGTAFYRVSKTDVDDRALAYGSPAT